MSDPGGANVREEALRAAAAAVDHFLGRIGDDSADRVGGLGAAARDRFRAEMGRVIDLNLDMVRNAFGLYGRLLDPETFLSSREDRLDFGATVPGASVATVLWVHNFDDEPMTGVGFVASSLLDPESGALDEAHWSFSPSTITVPTRAAVPVLVGLDVPEAASTGSYLGTISPRGREGEPIEVRLQVVRAGPITHDSW